MERLTERNKNGVAVLRTDRITGTLHDNPVARLAAYEDTGMTPGGIVALKAERDVAVQDPKEITDWFHIIVSRMRDYSDGDVWSDGSEILCKTESGADAISDLLFQLYADKGERPVIQTGYYDPEEDRRNGEEDYCTGWWYVTID